MLYLLVQHKVKDYSQWKRIFDAHAQKHKEVGFKLEKIWQFENDPNQFFFMLRVNDKEKAIAFMNTPEAAAAGEEAGVLEGHHWFVTETE